jgi:hypothetical protein
MAATDTPTKSPPPAKKPAAKRKAADGATPLVADQNARMHVDDGGEALNKEAAAAAAADADAMDALDPGMGNDTSWLDKPVDDLTEIRRWVIGKPPAEGGKESEYSVYVQQPLGWMARSRFFSIMTAAMSKAIRATGGEVAGMGDIFGEGGGTMRERAQRLTQRDFQDASNFAAMAMELSAYVPDLLLECYCIWMQVPNGERAWAKLVFEQPWDPEHNKWGLKDDEHRIVIGTFIDQNYEELRGFFTEDLPAIARRVVSNERARADHESESVPSKQSNTSGPQEAATS